MYDVSTQKNGPWLQPNSCSLMQTMIYPAVIHTWNVTNLARVNSKWATKCLRRKAIWPERKNENDYSIWLSGRFHKKEVSKPALRDTYIKGHPSKHPCNFRKRILSYDGADNYVYNDCGNHWGLINVSRRKWANFVNRGSASSRLALIFRFWTRQR